MSIDVALEHRTVYHFDRLVEVAPHVVRLRPAPQCRTPIRAYSLTVTPEDHFLNWQQDPFGNHQARLVFPERTRELSITVDLIADLTTINPFDFFVDEAAERYPFTYDEALARDLGPYLRVDEPGPLVARWLAALPPRPAGGTQIVDFLVEVNQRLQGDIDYMTRMEPGVQTPEETLEKAVGSCRDTGWLLVALLRHLGLAARFVSGYLVQLRADEPALDGPSGPAEDFTDLHAWAEVFVPGAGWVGLDPTSGLFAGEGHIPLSCTPEPATAAPVTGATAPCEVTLEFTNVVRRIREDPRVTYPYTDDQWVRIDTLGRAVDDDLAAHDVRLTMGGEPTFVAIDDMDAPQWNTEADGLGKRERAADLVDRLAARFAPGGVRHHGQGKWYPGEPLPRWQTAILWRADGQPLWRDPTLLAEPAMPASLVAAAAAAEQRAADAAAEELAAKELAAAEVAAGGEIGVGVTTEGERVEADPAAAVDRVEPNEVVPGSGDRTGDGPGIGPAEAAGFAADLAAALGIPGGCVLAAFEDPLVRLSAEARLPAGPPPGSGLDLADPTLWTAAGRAAAVAALDAEAGDPKGWVIPVHHLDGDDAGWATMRWDLRRGRLYLTAGDSPVGLRLPLDSLTWTPVPPAPDRSTFEAVAPLGPRPSDPAVAREDDLGADEPPIADPPAPRLAPGPVRAATAAPPGGAGAVGVVGAAPGVGAREVTPAPIVPVEDAPPTALCVEERGGRLHVFLPPLTHLEHAVDLLARIEAVAAARQTPVVLEGYPPPRDPRLRELVVAPDPGVIEVNVHPAASWPELTEIVAGVHVEARLARLGTEKFDLDGTHTGTGGGNHVTLGAAHPADSPLLRRPDLLPSMLTYWQHHPALSYLFSGRFIGPTSQAPRVDEGRAENLYELEIAIAELDALGPDAAPWMVDRLLRHLLVDITGNTHRAEFCIDKLFAPGTERGRLGLLELRGFEMPPHPRMALVQTLLVRALVARFWAEPYRGPLVRWGSELHDRFLLPWFAAADIAEVVDDLNRHGYAFEFEWLAPFLEFRFPRLGVTRVGDTTIELRAAIEPWNVLGEEVSAFGTSRYVDSSVERLQVRVDGFNAARHLVTCNGVPVPLSATGTPGSAVAGVRYRAWAPPSALHPTIGVQSPLVFDLVDRWSNRSLGGCTYHVVHPGGRSYDRFPVNANEAEARRVNRFEAHGHTPGPIDATAFASVIAPGPDEYPRTLDLRRASVPR